MREIKGNIWDFYVEDPLNYICITTNGFVKKNGECVMGRGCAQQCRDRFPEFAKELGKSIVDTGNRVYLFEKLRILTFPTKRVWWENSDLELIRKSTEQLIVFADNMPEVTFYLPRPGCSNGGLQWEDVREAIAPILPDNIIVITY